LSEEVEGDEDGAEENFFSNGTRDEVAVADPGEESGGSGRDVDAFNEEAFE
jgi:hypothetical protein